jgi:hypothetical protein
MVKPIDPKHFAAVCDALIQSGAKTATKYIDEKTVVRATWRNKIYRQKNVRRKEMVITFGAPNYLEADFIKRCKKAGEPLPVKKIQFRFYPVKKKVA